MRPSNLRRLPSPALILLIGFTAEVAFGGGPFESTSVDPAEASNTVRRLYREILRREPDAGGWHSYVQQMMGGRDEGWVRWALETSPEKAHQRAVSVRRRWRGVTVGIVGMAGMALGWAIHRRRSWEEPAAWGMLLVSVASFGFLLWRYSPPAPSWDEFDLVLGYFLRPFPERWRRLWALHNEHRMASLRL